MAHSRDSFHFKHCSDQFVFVDLFEQDAFGNMQRGRKKDMFT